MPCRVTREMTGKEWREQEDKLLIMCPNKPFQLMSAQPQQNYIIYANKSDGPDLALY